MSPENGFLWLNVLVFGAFGAAALIAPEALVAGAGVQLQPDSSTVDLRATYGGAGIGIALLLVLCMARAQVDIALLAVILLTGGALAGRLLGLALEPGLPILWQLALVEAFWVVFAGWLLGRHLRRRAAAG